MAASILIMLSLGWAQASYDLPRPSGSLRIGTQVLHFVDATRPDPVDPAFKREIMAQYWYPTSATTGRYAPYLPDSRFLKVLIDRTYYLQDKSLLQAWGKLKTHALLNVGVSRKERWPVLLLEPGLGMPRANYTAFCEDLASHGYFVASIDPTRGGLTILPSGRILDAGDDKANSDPAQQNKKTAEWAADFEFVLSQLQASADKLSIDSSRVGVLGHSMGGSAALQAAQDDSRISAALDMDGSGGVVGLDKGARVPMLFLKSNPNYSDADLAKLGRTREQWKAMGKKGPKMFPPLAPGVTSKPVFQASIRDTGHLSYSDAPFLMPNTITRFSNHSLAPKKTLDLTMRITRGFFDQYLRGKPWPVLSNLKSPWDQVTLAKLY